MSIKKIVISKDFSDRLLHLMALLGFKKRERGKFANSIGISAGYFSEIINLKTGPSFNLIFGISKIYPDINTNWLVTGCGEPFLSDVKTSEKQECDVLDIEHIGLVRKFKDKELALEINWDLLRLEELDPGSLREIRGYIKRMLIEADTGQPKKGEKAPPVNGTNGQPS